MTVRVRLVGSGDSFGSGGRFQTCILVEAPGIRFAIDFGASSLIALNQQGIAHNSIDVILLTHLHGDHCGGVPFLLMDAMLAAKRTRPLLIAGPKDTPTRMQEISEALFPGMHVMRPTFPPAVYGTGCRNTQPGAGSRGDPATGTSHLADKSAGTTRRSWR